MTTAFVTRWGWNMCWQKKQRVPFSGEGVKISYLLSIPVDYLVRAGILVFLEAAYPPTWPVEE